MTADKQPDRRVRRTKERLRSALACLIVEKPYDKITVQDLIDRADVGRSTFYAHYETKDDLLLSGLDRLTADIELHMADEPSSTAVLPSLGVFRHAAESHEQIKALLGSKGSDLVRHATLVAFTDRARTAIDENAGKRRSSDLPPDARAAFVAGSLLALLTWWLDNDMPHPPETMAEVYARSLAEL